MRPSAGRDHIGVAHDDADAAQVLAAYDHALAAEMDAELVGSDYEDKLGATQIRYAGLDEDSLDGDLQILPEPDHAPFRGYLDSDFLRLIAWQINMRVQGYRGVFEELDDELTLEGKVFQEAPPAPLELLTADVEQGGALVPDFTFPHQQPVSGRLIQRLCEQHNNLTRAWDTVARILEGEILVAPAAGEANVGNTGDGTLTVHAVGPAAIQETFEITYVEAEEHWTVEGTEEGPMDEAETGVPYLTQLISFTIEEGATPFEDGDQFHVAVEPIAGAAGTYLGVQTARVISARPGQRLPGLD
jgi:hypothetical protein